MVEGVVEIVLGAVLATCGGFAATQVTAMVDRRRRTSGAALLCGEVLAATDALVRLAEQARAGGPFDHQFVVRYLHAARREVDVYFRNRELVFSMPNAALRARVHSFVIRLSITSDRIFDAHARLATLVGTAAAPGEVASAQADLDQSFTYLIESRDLIPDLLAQLQPLARDRFDVYGQVDAEGLVPVEPQLLDRRGKKPRPHRATAPGAARPAEQT